MDNFKGNEPTSMRHTCRVFFGVAVMTASFFTVGCGPNDCSYLNVLPGTVSASSWRLSEASTGKTLVAFAPNWLMWLGQTGAGDGEHYELSIGPPDPEPGTGGAATLSEGTMRLTCYYISKQALMNSQAASIGDFCGRAAYLGPSLSLFYGGAWRVFAMSGGTVSATGGVPNKAGTTISMLDQPSTELASQDGMLSVILEFHDLSATVSRTEDHESCSIGGGGDGLGTYHGWRPGGG